MAIEEFIRPSDFKKIIEDKLIQSSSLKSILKQKGILPSCNSSQDLSELVYLHFLGSDTLSKIQDILNIENNNLKSTITIISPKRKETPENFLNDLSDELLLFNRDQYTQNKFEQVIKNDNSLSFQFSYQKKQKGKLNLIEKRTILLDVSIFPIKNTNNFKVNIQHKGSSEPKNLIDSLINISNKANIFNVNRVQLERLTKQHRIDFFDNFSQAVNKNIDWTLVDIVNVSVNKDITDLDNEDLNSLNDKEENLSTGLLSGIRSAILKGDGLRTNNFVQECMKQNFIFTSMSYKFENKDLPLTIVLEINFKHIDMKIIIDKIYEQDEDGKYNLITISSNEQKQYIDYFQNIAYDVFSNLLDEQKNMLSIINK